ncbi:MAG TPA: PIN-like domain-containing protein [Clostridium sp.]|uniref:PIN-like domain-containing protein n=1 Tax=Clostridium sp. TaxID=1506 RepID=UPI002F929E72
MGFIYEKEEFEKLFDKQPVIVMDTNVLLGLYSFTPETIEDIIGSFEKNLNFFWIPNQVYLEYTRHYEHIRKREANRFQNLKEEICKALSDSIGAVSKNYSAFNKYKLPEVDDSRNKLIENINNAMKTAKQDLDKLQVGHSERIACISEQNDIVYKFVTNIRKVSCADGFSMLELIDIYEEGEKRYKYKMPPGFTDINKPDKGEEYSDFVMRKYGDLIIWKEILRKIKDKDVNLIFIENEVKEDWWTYSKNRPKRIPLMLEEEFFKEAGDNSDFCMVTVDELISHFGNLLNIQPNSILEVNKRMDFIRGMEAYLTLNQYDIVQSYIEDNAIEQIIDNIKNILIGEGLGGGSISDVEHIEIIEIKVMESSFDYNQNECQITVNTGVIVENSSDVIVSFGRVDNVSMNISTIVKVEASLYLNIDNEKEPKKAIEYETVEFHNFKVKDIEYREYDGRTHFIDEDDYNGRSHRMSICPDCGEEFIEGSGGGNGFCIECASEH